MSLPLCCLNTGFDELVLKILSSDEDIRYTTRSSDGYDATIIRLTNFTMNCSMSICQQIYIRKGCDESSLIGDDVTTNLFVRQVMQRRRCTCSRFIIYILLQLQVVHIEIGPNPNSNTINNFLFSWISMKNQRSRGCTLNRCPTSLSQRSLRGSLPNKFALRYHSQEQILRRHSFFINLSNSTGRDETFAHAPNLQSVTSSCSIILRYCH